MLLAFTELLTFSYSHLEPPMSSTVQELTPTSSPPEEAITNGSSSAIPQPLKDVPRWVVWKSIRRGGNRTKPPFRVSDGGGASSTKPSDWAPYTEAYAAHVVGDYTGLGFMLGDGWAGVDLDNCLDEQGNLAPWAKEAVEMVGGYTEVSPSGRGLKIFCKGTLPGGVKGKKVKIEGGGAIEMYCQARYFTVTEDEHPLSTGELPDATEALAELYQKHVERTPAHINESAKAFCQRELAALPNSVDGNFGHDKMLRAACEIRRHGFDGAEAWELLHWFNDNKCDPPWSPSELDHKWKSACEKEPLGAKSVEAAKSLAPFELDLIVDREFDGETFERSFLVDQCVVVGEHLMVGGPHKSLKTSIMTDLGVSVATGSPFLGQFEIPEPRPVIFISGESGGATLQNLARRVRQAKGVDPTDNLYWGLRLPRLSLPQHLDALRRDIERTDAALCVVDPAYLAVLTAEGADGASNVMKMGQVLSGFGDVGVETGCTMCLVHHLSGKMKLGATPQLDNLAFAGFREWARQWLLLNHSKKRVAGRMFLKMALGGSAGHGGEYGLEIDEGRPDDPLVGRRWEVKVEDLEAEKSEEGETEGSGAVEESSEKPDDLTAKIIAALREAPEGLSRTKLSGRVGRNKATIDPVIERLVSEERAYWVQRVMSGNWTQCVVLNDLI